MKVRPIRYLAVAAVLLFAGTGWAFQTSTAPQPQAQANSPSQSPLVSLNTSISQFGSFLVDPNGMPLYVESTDFGGRTNCVGSCTSIWVPYTVQASTYLTKAANIPGKLGMLQRPDGTVQLTYNNLALYTYAKDAKGGAPTGEGINGIWYLATLDVYPGNVPQGTRSHSGGGSYSGGNSGGGGSYGGGMGGGMGGGGGHGY